MDNLIQLSSTSPPKPASGISPDRKHKLDSSESPCFENVLKQKCGAEEEKEAVSAMAALLASMSLAPQPDSSPAKGADSPTGGTTVVSTEAISAAAPTNIPVLQAAQPGTQAQAGVMLETLNAQPAFAGDLQAAQVSHNPAGVVDLTQQALTDGIATQDPAAQLVAFAEGETPEGQKQGVILDAKDASAAELVQKAEVAVVPAANAAVQPVKAGTQPVEKISVEPYAAAAVKEAPVEKAVKPVEKPASTQEAGMPSVEVSRGLVQAPEIQAKQGPSQAALAQQVTAGMELMMRQGRSSMHIQLSPQDLGGINIHLVSNSQGVTVTVTADQAGTGHLLQNQADQLRQALSDAGVQVANLNVGQQQLSGQFNQDRETFAQAQSNRFRVPREAVAEEPKPILGVYQAGRGSVDYRV